MKKWQGIVVVVVVEPSALTDMFWNNRANGIFTMKMYIHSFYFQPFIVRIPIFSSISKCSNDVSIIPRKPSNLIMFHRFAFLSVDTRSKLAGIFCIEMTGQRATSKIYRSFIFNTIKSHLKYSCYALNSISPIDALAITFEQTYTSIRRKIFMLKSKHSAAHCSIADIQKCYLYGL